MWDLYAQAGNGIAIRSTSRRLIDSLHHEGAMGLPGGPLTSLYVGQVRYIDYHSRALR